MATSIQLRACHGLPPYTWSKIGTVTLSSTEGTQITVTASGDEPTETVHFYRPKICYLYNECGDCGGGKTNAEWIGGPVLYGLDCQLNEVGTVVSGSGGAIGGSPFSNQEFTISPSIGNCTGGSENLTFPPSAVFVSGCCDAGGEVDATWTVTLAGVTGVNGVIHAGAAAFSGSATGLGPNRVCGVPGTCIDADFDGDDLLDVRTQAMVDSPECCDLTNASVTVTDAAGVSVTYALT